MNEVAELIKLLEFLGARQIETSHDEYGEKITSTCVMHHDNNPSFMLRPGSHVFNCFACGAGPDLGYNSPTHVGLVPLVQKNHMHSTGKKLSLERARKIVNKFVSPAFQQRNGKWKKKFSDDHNYMEPIPDSHLAAYFPSNKAYEYMESRGLGKAVCEEHQIGFDKQRNRVVIPIRNELGELITFSGRITTSKEKLDKINEKRIAKNLRPVPRYLIYNKAPRRFLMLNAQYAVENEGSIILVESAMDYLALRQFGYKNVVCIFGSHLSNYQWSLISHYKKIYAFLDNDKAGASGIEALVTRIKDTNNIIYVPDYNPEDTDFDEMNKSRFDEIYSGAVSVSRFKKRIALVD